MTFSTIFVAISLLRLKKCSSSSVSACARPPVDELGANLRVAELVLRLRFKHRVLEANRDRADHAFAHVVALELALGVFVHRLEQALAKRAQVRAAVAGVLAVDERVERLAVARIAVGETIHGETVAQETFDLEQLSFGKNSTRRRRLKFRM